MSTDLCSLVIWTSSSSAQLICTLSSSSSCWRVMDWFSISRAWRMLTVALSTSSAHAATCQLWLSTFSTSVFLTTVNCAGCHHLSVLRLSTWLPTTGYGVFWPRIVSFPVFRCRRCFMSSIWMAMRSCSFTALPSVNSSMCRYQFGELLVVKGVVRVVWWRMSSSKAGAEVHGSNAILRKNNRHTGAMSVTFRAGIIKKWCQ